MGYFFNNNNKSKTINNIPFLVLHEVLIFDTLGNEIALRGTAKVDLYFGTGAPDDYDDHTVEIESAEICYDYTAPTKENPNPSNQWYSVANLEAELTRNAKPETLELWEEIKNMVIEYAYEHQYEESEVEF